MRNIRLTIAYDGTNFNGWQKQINTRNTIQEILEKALKKILQEKVEIIGSGRTDAGVHAKAQVANFLTSKKISLDKLHAAVNATLPKSIKITQIKKVSEKFHSRFDAKEKWYRYTILNQYYPDVFNRDFFYLLRWAPLNINLMRKAVSYLEGKHDFSSFRISGENDKKSSIRNIESIKIAKKGNYIFIDVHGKSFLYKMVRSFVGTLIEVGRGKIPPEEIKKILEKKDRKFAGPTAAACGLCLMRIKY